jgi:PAS domain S-box-containing protein
MLLLDSAADAVYVIDEHGRITYVNDYACRVLGYDRDQLLRLSLFEISPGVTPTAFLAARKTTQEGEIRTTEAWHKRRDGSQFPVEVRASLKMINGKAYSLTMVRDISERKAAQHKMAELQFAVENAVDAVYILNADGRIHYANHSACRALGYSSAELAGMNVTDIEPELTSENLARHLELNRDGRMQSRETIHRRKDGTFFPVEINFSVKSFQDVDYSFAFVRDISERRRAAEALQIYEQIVNASDSSMLFIDTDYIYQAANQTFLNSFDKTREEVVGHNIIEVMGREHFEKFSKPNIDKCLQGESISFQTWFSHPLRGRHYLDVHYIPYRRADGAIAGVVISAHDITSLKQAQERIEQSEQQLKQAQRLAHMGFWEWRIAAGETFWSDETYRIFGLSPGQLSTDLDDFLLMIHPGDRQAVAKCLDAALNGERLYDMDYRIVLPDGAVKCIHAQGEVYRDANGAAVKMFGTVQDITERKTQAEQMEELRFAVENAVDAIFLTEPDGRIFYANRSACKSLGYSYDELTRLNSGDIDPTLTPEMRSEFRQRQQLAEPQTIETIHRRKDGTTFPVELTFRFNPRGESGYSCAIVRDITERKRAARAMEELQFAVRNATDGVVIYDRNARIRYVNDSMCKALGYSEAELTAMNLFEFAVELNETMWPERWRTAQEYRIKGIPRLVETWHRRKDGTVFPVEVATNYAEFYGVGYGYSFVRDITQRRAVERRMQLLNFAVENATEGLYVIEESGRIIHINKHVRDQLGYSDAEIIGKFVMDIDPDMTLEYWRESWRVAKDYAKAGRQRLLESRHVRKDGTIFPVEVSIYHAEFEGSGYHFTFVRDITERKKAARQTEELRFAVDNANDAVYLNNRNGDIYYVNKSACQQLGYSFAELTAMNIADIDPDFSTESLSRRLENRNAHLSAAPETWHYRKDGTRFPVEVTFNSREFDGIEYLCSFARDITERKRTEEELRKYREHLEELVESRTAELRRTQEKLVQKEKLAVLGQLTGVVSHELRNPLGTIRSSIYLLRDKLNNKSELTERAIARAERNITRCDQIIEELLDYARAPQTIKRSVALDGWLADVLEEYAVPDDIAVKIELVAGVNVALDTDRFERCIINVLANACEALRETESTPKLVHVQTRAATDNVEIRIIDNGPGIAEELLGRVFEPLFSTKSFGVGLGLPIVEQIMQQHDGKVTLRSSAGAGTMVTLCLPIAAHTNESDIT